MAEDKSSGSDWPQPGPGSRCCHGNLGFKDGAARGQRGSRDLRTCSGLLLALTFLVDSEEMVLLIKKNIGLILKKKFYLQSITKILKGDVYV